MQEYLFDCSIARSETWMRKVAAANHTKADFEDPLRTSSAHVTVSSCNQSFHYTSKESFCSDEGSQLSKKEWVVFSKSLMQKFSSSNMIMMPTALDFSARDSKEYIETPATVHIEDLEDPDIRVKEEKKVFTQQEYASQLQELKRKIDQAWKAGDHIKALKLSIKVSRLLIDTSVLQFYPTLFLLVIDILDIFGDMVWERIKKKAECSEDGALICPLPENFLAVDVCTEAKETCHNWFCKIGSIRELLPRLYLELAILRCRHFMDDNHEANLHRLTRMMRGLADPLAFAYCHLYMACRATLLPCKDYGYLVVSISDINFFMRTILEKETSQTHVSGKRKLIVNLMEPAIEWIMKCIFMQGRQMASHALVKFGFTKIALDPTWNVPWTSIVFHNLLKQLPGEIVCVHGLDILELLEQTKDATVSQHLNYRLLGLRLSEGQSHLAYSDSLLRRIMQVLSQYYHLEEYLVVANSYLDIILQCSADGTLSSILEGIPLRATNTRLDESELDALLSILMKLLDHFNSIDEFFALEHFTAIHKLLNGIPKNVINMHILEKAIRSQSISNLTTVPDLFEISKALHDSIDILNEDHQQQSYLICRFIQKVNFGDDREHHLSFLAACRAAFSFFDVIMDILAHLSNNLAVTAIKANSKFSNFVKACVAFNEVTIPSISNPITCMNLFIATAEVALFGGLVSHAAELLNSAFDCLQYLDISGTCKSINEDEILSVSCKLCSILVFSSGIHVGGIAEIPKLLKSVVNQSFLPTRVRTKILSTVISLCAYLSQDMLPLPAKNIKSVGNEDLQFFGDESCEELLFLTSDALQDLFSAIEQEPILASRGKLALEAFNFLIITFEVNQELHLKCSKLIDIAKSCLDSKDKFLQTTVSLFVKHFEGL
ncbi:hypothetical protein HPP92_008858 [Vanilla planifolia]|uniref:Uncharacterized protein n=1 Tax=Vanilla planifolia TaxID=51239 RepID=A0A835V2C0_VANPL|nr:hypothetical protein HPP92_008858 [Vanilla planifolia]